MNESTSHLTGIYRDPNDTAVKEFLEWQQAVAEERGEMGVTAVHEAFETCDEPTKQWEMTGAVVEFTDGTHGVWFSDAEIADRGLTRAEALDRLETWHQDCQVLENERVEILKEGPKEENEVN